MRTQILDTIIKSQEELVNNLIKSVETYESSTDLDEQDTIDLDDQSHQADLQDLKIEMTQKLNMEQNDLRHIKNLKVREVNTVEEGAVVETDAAYFFIGFTFTPIEFEGKKILGVSLEAPAYKNNKDKKKGDKLILGETQQKIISIY